MNFRTISIFIISILFLQSCTSSVDQRDIEKYFSKLSDSLQLKSEVNFAKGFDIYKLDNISKIVVKNPEQPNNIIAEYYLVDKQTTKQKFNANNNIIVVPLNRAAVFSGTQLSAIIKIGLLQKVVGVSEADYILDTAIRSLISKGQIKELASNGEFYLETALMVNPEVIFHSPYKANENHPLAKTKITMIPFMDFKETTALGRAEWIKFTAAFFGEKQKADSIFENIVVEYNKYVELAANASTKPTVFSDKFFNDQWYVPGGKSYVANLFKDAGADYVWKADSGVASFPLDYEVVYKKAVNTDFWRIVGSYNDIGTYEFLKSENELYSHFDAFKNKKIIWCDAKATTYFENSPLEPHIVLADLIHCFHPELLSDYKPKYYFLMK